MGAVNQKMLSRLVFFGWMTIATSGSVMRSSRSVVMTRVERVCSGSSQCLTFSSCSPLKGRNKQDTLQAIRQLQCGFLWQLTNGLLSGPIFATKKGRGRWRQCQCQCELEDKSGHWRTQCKDGKLSSQR